MRQRLSKIAHLLGSRKQDTSPGVPVNNGLKGRAQEEVERGTNLHESMTQGEKEQGVGEHQEKSDEEVLRAQEIILCKIKKKKAGLKIAVSQQRARNVVVVGRSRAGKFL